MNEALVAAAELKRRKYESSKRLDKLKEQRRAIEEIRDSLADDEKVLLGYLASAEENRDRLVEKMDSMTQQMSDTGREIYELEREVAILERRYSENTLRERELADEIESVQNDVMAARDEISYVANELETGRATLARLDRKLALDKWRR
jgi:chromosome segregation ATPase